jgi:predicted RNA-binding protein with PUA-like domain
MKEMRVGDLALFYHSSSEPSGVYGIAKVVSVPHADETALDPNDEHYDPKAMMYEFEGKGALWECVDMEFVKKLEKPLSLEAIKKDKELKKMLVAQTGQRLSVMPVEEGHFKRCLMMEK